MSSNYHIVVAEVEPDKPLNQSKFIEPATTKCTFVESDQKIKVCLAEYFLYWHCFSCVIASVNTIKISYLDKSYFNLMMAHIHLTTFIAAPANRVFDLSRSITLHKKSMAHTNETAIAGTTSGLIKKGETVTWQGKHFFKVRQFTSAITEMDIPVMFTDEMKQGDFKNYSHQHHFKQVQNGTIMIDIVDFESPYGIIGKAANSLFLKKYMEKLLTQRNKLIKEYAESEKWKAILN